MATNDSSCSIHLINKGLTVNQDTAVIEFTVRGRPAYNSCNLDGQKSYPCKWYSSVEVQPTGSVVGCTTV